MGASSRAKRRPCSRTDITVSSTASTKSCSCRPIALVPGKRNCASQERTIPLGLFSVGQAPRARPTRTETSMLIGQMYLQRWHCVQVQIHGVVDNSSFMSSMAMRMKRRGSMPSSPEAGQPAEHSPQLRQAS